MSSRLLQTQPSKAIAILRIIAGLPLVMFGMMHLTGASPMEPLVEAAGLPMPALTAIVAPIVQVLAGLMLLIGAGTRVGATMGMIVSLGGLITNLEIPNDQWPTPSEADPSVIVMGTEPAFLTPLAITIIVLSAIVLFKGAGAWSLDHRCGGSPDPHEEDTL
ncbi:MAG: DoxX family protein [Phycisphaerales bacterium JB052]